MIAVPDSVAFYWGDAVNRAAVDVLGGSNQVPTDLTLAEAERFELANLAARRVRVEYWQMLRSVWSATWESAVRTHLPKAKLLSYGGHRTAMVTLNETYADPSVDYAWDNDGCSGLFELPGGGYFFTAVWLIEAEQEVQLQFYALDAEWSCATSDTLDLGPDWGDDGENRRQTRSGLLVLTRGEGLIEAELFAARAQEAMKALAAALP